MYISRYFEQKIVDLLGYFPAIAIVGPRQVGKTSLARHIAESAQKKAHYFDLEDPDDRAKFANPSLLLDPMAHELVILDEVQRLPQLFPVLRGIIDRNRQPGRFILLGSASPDLIRDASETLAGRIAYLELPPFLYREVQHMVDWRTHFFRGGFHGSMLAPNEELARTWRKNFIATYLERDLPALGLAAEPTLTAKLWRMLAHLNGSILNMEQLAGGLGISNTSVRRYIDFFESAYLIRRLQPFATNLKKRLVKAPKIYLRDAGILHHLLGIQGFEEILGHPIVGTSWETYAIEQLAALLPDWYEMYYYRTYEGTEADLVLTRGGKPEILVEFKFSTAPAMTKSLYVAKADLGTKHHYIVCPVDTPYPITEDVEVVGLQHLHRIFSPTGA
jgi:uncharacterized protein